MDAEVMPALSVPDPWTAETLSRTRGSGELRLRRPASGTAGAASGGDGVLVEVRVERCVAGRLREAYPVGAHDVEIRVADGTPPALRTEVLAVLVGAIRAADPRCRRAVFAAPVDRPDVVAAAQAAGFRYVLDVDVPGAELSLLVAEPEWVTCVGMDLDRVPGA
ncbi:hypothetical protein [Microtetraspora malaysiensis]|uniref:hypothetical protein n=1 Tax=Microtetraspora malaysiensis TaxID=161358 RepID=UPI0012F72519|nr:hypothetical protein [Microtetraspora malaysiensis]